MNDLDEIARRLARLQERLVSAVVFTAAATVSALVIPAEQGFMMLVALGAAGWTAIELTRLRLAGDDRVEALDRLVLAGSSDQRCAQRRAQLRSPQVQHGLARMLRQTCTQAHTRNPMIGWLLDRRAVRAVEDDLRELAEVFDRDAGNVPPEAVVRTRILIASPASPLCPARDGTDSLKRPVRDAEMMIARCRAELRH